MKPTSDEQQEPMQFGTIEMVGKDVSIIGQRYNRLACTRRGEILLLSLIGNSADIKRVRACMLGGAKVGIQAAGAKIKQASQEDWQAANPGHIHATEEGYEFHKHKIGYGMEHALFLTRAPGFMRVVSPNSLWHELQKDRFTTPLMPEWMPYIEAKLREKEYLTEAFTYNCSCGLLSMTTPQLDEIVEKGIRTRKLLIPSTTLSAVQATA
jgi:hypothetical protein